MKNATLALCLLPLFSQTIDAAEDQPPCGEAQAIEKYLQTEYGESPVIAGVTRGGILYVTANPDTGTFTVLLRGNGVSCVITEGKGFAEMGATKPGDNL